MTERWHRFRTQVVGHRWIYGLAFDSEASLEEFLAARGVTPVAQTSAIRTEASDKPCQPGRPSFNSMLDGPVTALREQLGRCNTQSARARLVLKHLALTHAADELPDTRTVIRYLSERPVGQKHGQKCGQKKNRGSIVAQED
jgi:hypothetical protein